MDLEYYQQRAVRIYPTTNNGTLPGEGDLRSSLERFGTILDLRKFRLKGKKSVNGLPNTAIVVFSLPDGVNRTLQSLRSNGRTSLWQTHDVAAESFRKSGPLSEFFTRKVFPRLSKKLNESTPDSDDSSEPEDQSENSSSEDDQPPAKRSRTDNWASKFNASATPNDYESSSESPQTSSASAGVPNRMQARIAELEVELQNARRTRMMPAFERDILQATHQAELHAATSRRYDAEDALARREIELFQLRSKLETALTREAALTNDLKTLQDQLAIADEKLRAAQSPADESAALARRVKDLEMELEAARDFEHKLRIQNSLQERQLANPDTTELDQAKAKAKQLESEVKALESDLLSTDAQLKSMQNSLKSMQKSLDQAEEKYSSTRSLYESTRAKLGVYKSRLETEQTIRQKFKDTLTPDVYRSFGATYETLGALLSITEPPPMSEEGDGRLKQSD